MYTIFTKKFLVRHAPSGPSSRAATDVSYSEIANLNLVDVVNIDLSPYFTNITNLLNALIETDAVAVFEKIIDDTNSEKLSNTVKNCMGLYKPFLEHVSTTAAEEEAFNSSIEISIMSAAKITPEIEEFKRATDELVDYLRESTPDIYMAILNNTMFKMIDGVHFDLYLHAREFRRSVSVCSVLILFYKEFVHIMCEHILYPWSACWLGAFLVDIFLLVSVFLCLYSIPLFLKVRRKRPSKQAVIIPDDIRSTQPVTFSKLEPYFPKPSIPHSSKDISGRASTSRIPVVSELSYKTGKFKPTKSEEIIGLRLSASDSPSGRSETALKSNLKPPVSIATQMLEDLEANDQNIESEVQKTLEEITKEIGQINVPIANSSGSPVAIATQVLEDLEANDQNIESEVEKTLEEVMKEIGEIDVAVVNSSGSEISNASAESNAKKLIVEQASYVPEHSDRKEKAVEERTRKSVEELLRQAESKKSVNFRK